jgi:hypothetical protein
MNHLEKNYRYLITAATIFTLAIITASIVATAPAAAATTATEATTTTMPPASPSSGLELSPQPVLLERQISQSQTPINQTHILFTDSGNGTITLPNTTEAINFTGTDSVVVSIVDGTAVGKEVFTTVDGSETVNGTVFGIARFNMEEGTGKAIIILLLQTNSTGRLAPVDGMILAGHIEFFPDGSAEATMWEWQSGVPLPNANTTAATTTTTTTPEKIELSPQPIYQDQIRGVSETLVNETYTLSTVSGNGTLTLANGTEPIRTTSSGNLIVFDKFILPMKGTTTAIATGKQTIITEEDGSEENATATLYEIAQFDLQDYTGKGITIAVVHTNSTTGMLAPLNGMILVGQEEFRADGSRLVTMWEWQSGVPLPTTAATAADNAEDDQ